MKKRKKIGLINIDSKMPNLALMKLAKWHKEKGDDVVFIDLSSLNVDQWYGSKIYMGGSGYDIKGKLPKGIEALTPDYKLFNTDYSIGYTSRGCIRDCGFCIIKEKEGNLHECDFKKDIKNSKFIVLDNNFLASPKWKEKLQFFIDNEIKVSFIQGLDIRFIDEEKAKMLSQVQYYDRTFKYKFLYFAFDDPKLEKIFRKKIKILLKYIRSYKLIIYILVGYNTTFEQDMHRFNVVREYGCDPFIMRYNNRKDDLRLIDLSRWVNKKVYRSCDFKDYKNRKDQK